jgi:hypothetical protein
MASSRLQSILIAGVWAGVLLAIATLLFQLGAQDQRYQLADLKEDPLYLRGPGFRIAGGIIISLILVIVAIGLASRRISTRWIWLLLIAGWGGYAAGSASAIARGGPVDHPGAMRLEFGSPLGTSVDLAATCRTAPGAPGTVVLVSADGVAFRVQFRDAVTGMARQYPAPDGVSIEVYGDPSAGHLPVIPKLPSTFLDGYFYVAKTSTLSDREGTVRAVASRHTRPDGSQLVPNDPWPSSYALTVTWTCDLVTTKAPQATMPTPTQGL